MVRLRCRFGFHVLAALTAILAFLASNGAEANEPAARDARAKVYDSLTPRELIGWLSLETETLVVARGPFRVSAENENVKSVTLNALLEAAATSLVCEIREHSFRKFLVGKTVSIAVHGAMRFRLPKRWGFGPYDGCDVMVFQNGLGAEGDSLVKYLRQEADKVVQIEGHDVFHFTEKWADDSWEIYVSLPQTNVLLCATSRDYLRKVLQRRKRNRAENDLSGTFSGWEGLNDLAPFWALRRFDKPAPWEPAGLKGGRLMFALDGGFDLKPCLKYILPAKANQDVVDYLEYVWGTKDYRLGVKAGPGKSGMVEVMAKNKTGEKADELWLRLMFALGHFIAI